jgi:endonuclease I
MLRYPNAIGDGPGEHTAARLEVLLRWHNDYPPEEYEQHRNQTIFARQGNRNPLIDFPQHARRIAFNNGFGKF